MTCRLVFSYFFPHFIFFRCASMFLYFLGTLPNEELVPPVLLRNSSRIPLRPGGFFCATSGLFLSSLKTKAWEAPYYRIFLHVFHPVPLAGVPSTRSPPARNLFFYYERGSGCPSQKQMKLWSKTKEGWEWLAVDGLVRAGLKMLKETCFSS